MADMNTVVGNALLSDQDHDARTGIETTAGNTGALRRKYNFGSYVSELALAQDPFFRFLSMVAKKPTDDPAFKFTEKRSSYTKRYAYMVGYDAAGGSTFANPDAGDHTATADSSVYSFKFYTDYNSEGNLQNIKGQAVKYFAGVTGTQPKFFVPGQIIKIAAASSDSNTPTEYELWKVNTVDLGTANYAIVKATCVKGAAAARRYPDPTDSVANGGPGLGTTSTETTQSQEVCEPFKCYVVGSAHAAGSGYPETWADQPYSTSHGQTQIFKTSAVMNNTDRATVLKYEGNEWARIWKEKLIEHKWDIENSLLFGSLNSTANTTEGAVDFIQTYGNSFSLSTSTKTQDDFLDDLSAMLDPRYNNAGSTVFFCNTAVYNWLHKLSGYFANNIEISPNYRADFSISGKKKVFGVDITTISTVYGDMNVARNVHLDGTNVKMIGINMKYCAYRPLVGNGINRDTSVYVGVQTLENSGVDRRVDQILTEAGMEWCCPETHAIWV
tara:strand:- start:5997 stop:7493 length:1497 start_codon:yes stop_codon:yes gene_type:complete